MVNGAFNLLPRPRDLRLQIGDPRGQLVDRERIEVLARKLGDQVARAAGKAVVGFHDPDR